ncbi:hypothetical protein [Streptomyces silvensis]|uniref:Uncharacterized protein n=1 Tax=Streptomyces silvensis TaxID=1765722 RepID=A0A0W7X3I8_9ACTN|nr:hypothetical protein [Streptomyces silvensis]KUF17375.1 hypothetical protein AT728_16370 [Streptomyces silvensis]
MNEYESHDDESAPQISVRFWLGECWTEGPDVNLDGDFEQEVAALPRIGEVVRWQESHFFETVAVLHHVTSFGVDYHAFLDPAEDAARERLHRLGGLCLRDRFVLAHQSGTPISQIAQAADLGPSDVVRYMREQTELAAADGRDLAAEVTSGGTEGVDIAGLDTGAVLAALWNHLPTAEGEREAPLSAEEARTLFDAREGRVDTLYGRRMQVVLTGDRFNAWLYNHKNAVPTGWGCGSPGAATAQAVIEHLRATGDVTGAPLRSNTEYGQAMQARLAAVLESGH